MGILIEDLLNFGNLIDKEVEVKLGTQELKRAYPELDFEINDCLLKILKRKRSLLFWKTKEIRLSDTGGSVRKDRENSGQWIFFRVLSKDGLEDVLNVKGFVLEGDLLGMDVMPAVSLTELYEKIPRQFRERLLISRYRIGKDALHVFFRFEK